VSHPAFVAFDRVSLAYDEASGYAVEDAIPLTDAAVGFIQKPYRPAELVRAVRHALS
jgi:hypothetical protein